MPVQTWRYHNGEEVYHQCVLLQSWDDHFGVTTWLPIRTGPGDIVDIFRVRNTEVEVEMKFVHDDDELRNWRVVCY